MIKRQEILEQWQSLAPRERDLWIGKDIMGDANLDEVPEHDWKRDEDGEIDMCAWDADRHNGLLCNRCGYMYCRHCQGKKPVTEPCRVTPRPYTTTWDGAGRVVERMREKGYAWRAHREVGKQVAWLFDGRASGIPIKADDSAVGTFDAAGLLVAVPDYQWAYCDTEAEAIALAALLTTAED